MNYAMKAGFDKKVSGPLSNIRDIALDGLFTAKTTEPNWQKAHNILMPAFSMGAMSNYFPMMLEIAEQNDDAGGGNLMPMMRSMFLRIWLG